MSKRISLSESYLASVIDKVLYENRKVIKVSGGHQNSGQIGVDTGNAMQPPMDDTEANAGNMPPIGGNSVEEMPPMDGQDADASSMDGQNGGSDFDTNFDAGVEADEDSDPKKYIQQLTGKLSQSLNSYNSDNGGDSDLSKYVANMILAAACKNIEEDDKKDLIEKIKSANGDSNDFSDSEGEETEMPEDEIGDEQEMPEGEMDGEQEMPMNESLFDKILSEMFNDAIADEENDRPMENSNNRQDVPNAWKNNIEK